MSRALPTPASKIKGSAVPSSLRIEKPAMCRSGLSPMPRLAWALSPSWPPIPIIVPPIIMPRPPIMRRAANPWAVRPPPCSLL